jgi:hypothetical protein
MSEPAIVEQIKSLMNRTTVAWRHGDEAEKRQTYNEILALTKRLKSLKPHTNKE